MGINIDEVHGIVEIKSDVFVSERVRISGVGTGVAYASGDAFGSVLTFEVPKKGIISNVIFIDVDDEGIQKDLIIFPRYFTPTPDNDPFNVTDEFTQLALGWVRILDFMDLNNSQIGKATPALDYEAPEGRLYCQLITRGADNIAAGSLPYIFLTIR